MLHQNIILDRNITLYQTHYVGSKGHIALKRHIA